MDEKTYVPSLTLNPTQAAAQEAPAAPQLVVEEEKPAVEPEKLDIDRLSPEEQAAVREFAKQIDVTDTNLVLSYGAAAQKNIADFSETALGSVRTKDMGEVGDMISSLVVEARPEAVDAVEAGLAPGFGLETAFPRIALEHDVQSRGRKLVHLEK